MFFFCFNLADNHNEIEQMLNVQYVPCVAGCLCVKTKQETQCVSRQSSIAAAQSGLSL